nr:site-specific DNA-methyltransferase [Fibrobacter succinogenes]
MQKEKILMPGGFTFLLEVFVPTLNWLGKDAVLNHHLDVPYRTLELKESFNCESGKSENKIIHGDNLEALKALLPEYEGRVKCIYIDPPYNTGEENWVYNDNVDSPKIRNWLGQVVGKEAEDLTRHDKWLCMMYPRLKLLQKLLSEDGAIFISIDDNEQANLKLMCDEIFGAGNFVSNLIWQKKFSPQNDSKWFSDNHDFIVCYAKKKYIWHPNLMERSLESDSRYKNPDNDPRGPWASTDLAVKSYTKEYDYPIITPSGRMVYPSKGRCWMTSKERMDQLIKDNRIWFGMSNDNVPRYKTFLNEVQKGIVPLSIWLYEDVGHNQSAKQELKEIFPEEHNPFDTPKPTRLIERILQIATDKNSIILDSFAGSGTTAHAVLNMNKQDGGNRKFILVEMEDYADSITAERVRRVIKGYKADKKIELYSKEMTVNDLKNASDFLEEIKCIREERREDFSSFKTEFENNTLKLYGVAKGDEEGTGGDFNFYELGPEMILDGNLNEHQSVEKIRSYIYYTETGTPIDKENVKESKHEFFLGDFDNTAYYLFYKKKEITTLDFDFLSTIQIPSERYVIYADNCVLPKDFLFEHNITFKKIPRDVRKF